MQDFIRRKNIENLTRQLANGQLDDAQRRYAQQKLAEELAAQRDAGHAREEGPSEEVPPPTGGNGGRHAASC